MKYYLYQEIKKKKTGEKEKKSDTHAFVDFSRVSRFFTVILTKTITLYLQIN